MIRWNDPVKYQDVFCSKLAEHIIRWMPLPWEYPDNDIQEKKKKWGIFNLTMIKCKIICSTIHVTFFMGDNIVFLNTPVQSKSDTSKSHLSITWVFKGKVSDNFGMKWGRTLFFFNVTWTEYSLLYSAQH